MGSFFIGFFLFLLFVPIIAMMWGIAIEIIKDIFKYW